MDFIYKDINSELAYQYLKKNLLPNIEEYTKAKCFGCYFNNQLIAVSRVVTGTTRKENIDLIKNANIHINLEDIAYLAGIFINENFRGLGISKELVNLRLKYISNLNFIKLIVTDIRETNPINYNFKEIGRFKNPLNPKINMICLISFK